MTDVTMILPTLNEAQAIDEIIAELQQRYPDIRILVMDDNSTDGTQTAVQARIQRQQSNLLQMVVRKPPLIAGLTASVLDGIRRCQTRFFIVMDADFQHPPEAVADFIGHFKNQKKFVVGARKPYRDKQPLHRFLISRTATRLAQIYGRIRGFRVADPMSGFFGGETAVFRALMDRYPQRFEPEGYKVLFDFLRVADRTLQPVQVWYSFGLRAQGHSKFNSRHGWLFLRSFTR